ncbi:MAG: hypothetical protein ACFFD7_03020 [Candidatus Thorarchaeota archaeon]
MSWSIINKEKDRGRSIHQKGSMSRDKMTDKDVINIKKNTQIRNKPFF